MLERLRALRPQDPLLVVPTSADVDHYRRELAAAGIVFGAEVLTFRRLIGEIAAAAGVHGRPLGPVARERVVRAAVRDTQLRVLARRRAHPASPRGRRPVRRARRSLVTPARFTRALRGWAAAARRPRTPRSSPRSTRPTTGGWRRSAAATSRATPAPRWTRCASPAAWGARPVLLYGFDDLDPLQLDAVETLAGRAEAEVSVALPYEPGRAAFAGRAATVELLKPLAARHVVLEDRSEHYAAPARRALHHLERRLFEGGGEPCSPNGAVRLLEAGGERAEAELVAAEVLELMREGVAPEDIAVLVREGGAAVEVLAAVLADYGVPVAPRRAACRSRAPGSAPACSRSPARRSRAARAADVITWLRTPGKLADPDAADALDARARRTEAATAADARRLWEGAAADELDALAEAAAAGPVELLEALLAEAEAIWTAPHRRRAAVLGPEEAADARTAARAARRRARAALARRGRPRAAGRRAEEVLEALAGDRGPPGRGARRRARRRPRRRSARAASARSSSAGCRTASSRAARRPSRSSTTTRAPRWRAPAGSSCAATRTCSGEERHLFYACVSRPEEVAVPLLPLLRRGGRPGAAVAVRRRRPRAVHRRAVARARHAAAGRGHLAARDGADAARAAARAGGRRERAPEPAALARARRRDAVLAALAARGPEAARGLETFAACGVRWLVEARAQARAGGARPGADAPRLARPRGARGDAARAASERTGSARLAPDTLDAALAELDRALGAVRASRGRELATARGRAGAAGARGGPRALPAPRGRDRRRDGAAVARVELRPRGRQPRRAGAQRLGLLRHRAASTGSTSTASGAAVVRDYKGKTVHAGARWAQDGRLQAALYALAARELLGLEPAGALYQPIGKGDRRPRGFVRRRHAGPLRQRRRRRARGARRRAAGGARRGARRPRARCARAGSARARRAARRTAAPTRGSAAPASRRRWRGVSAPRFTAEQRAAIEDRAGSALLAANAGSGKTAVMVERFVEAVLLDGVPVGSILALTFTEKAAGELRERVRRRLTRPRRGRARARRRRRLDRHDPRLLRAGAALAAARRRAGPALRGARGGRRRAARRGRLRARARGVGGRARAARRSTSPPPTGRACATSCSARTTRCAAAGADAAARRSRPSGPAPSGAALADARAVAAARPGGSRRRHPRERGPQRARGVRAGARRAAACRRRASWTRRSSARARRRSRRRRARPTAAPGRPTGGACADHHARAALILLDELLRPLRRRVRRGQGRARRGGLRGPRARRARAARRRGRAAPLERALRAADGRRVPGHQPPAARPAGGARAREPVRGRRRVPVDLPLPPRRRRDLPRAAREAGRGAGARAAGQLPLGAGAAGRARRRLRAGVRRALPAARGGAPRASRAAAVPDTRSCGCSTPTRPRARRPSSCSSPTPGAGTSTRASSGSARSRAAVAARGGALVATGCARRSAPAAVRRRRRARARDRLAAAVRAGARGAGPAHLRRRRPRLLVPGAGPRRPRYLAALANPRDETASTACSPRRSAASAATRSSCSPGGPRRRPRAVGRARAARGRARRRRRRGARRGAPARRDCRRPCPRRPGGSCASRLFAPSAPGGALPRALLERAITARATTSRSSPGRRRAAAGEPAQADAAGARVRAREGRDLRGFLDFAITQDLARRARARRRSSPTGSTPCG